jgi:hypothetical protein
MPREHIERRLTLAQALAQEDGVPELAEHGGDRTKADEQASIRSLPSHGTTGGHAISMSSGSTHAAYLVARLKRDAPQRPRTCHDPRKPARHDIPPQTGYAADQHDLARRGRYCMATTATAGIYPLSAGADTTTTQACADPVAVGGRFGGLNTGRGGSQAHIGRGPEGARGGRRQAIAR